MNPSAEERSQLGPVLSPTEKPALSEQPTHGVKVIVGIDTAGTEVRVDMVDCDIRTR